uniref:Uncharacterized protein n=1 Tax=Rhizophagus irregularis (strain DAOM 181602 / DAOM 197198 / MUCL 43194) TaxID=747089 RepID=U9UT15_RHIID
MFLLISSLLLKISKSSHFLTLFKMVKIHNSSSSQIWVKIPFRHKDLSDYLLNPGANREWKRNAPGLARFKMEVNGKLKRWENIVTADGYYYIHGYKDLFLPSLL